MPPAPTDEQESLYCLATRRQIQTLLSCLSVLGITQKQFLSEAKVRYGWEGVNPGTLSKAKTTDLAKLQSDSDYVVGYATLAQIEQMAGHLVWEIVQERGNDESLLQQLAQKGGHLDDLKRYTHLEAQAEILPPGHILRHDWPMRMAARPWGIGSVVLFLTLCYLVAPYSLAFLLDVWDKPEYAFSDSNNLLIGYPLSIISSTFVYLFYNSLPDSLNGFAHATNNPEGLRAWAAKAFCTLRHCALGIGLFCFGFVCFVQYGYLTDKGHSFWESEPGSPNLLFFLNLFLFSWQLFLFLYPLCCLILAARLLRRLSADQHSASPHILRAPPALPFIGTLAKPIIWIIGILILTCIYSLTFLTSMNNVSRKYSTSLLAADWQVGETLFMFIPLLLYLLAVYAYSQPIAQMHLRRRKISARDIFGAFGSILQTYLPFLPKSSS